MMIDVLLKQIARIMFESINIVLIVVAEDCWINQVAIGEED